MTEYRREYERLWRLANPERIRMIGRRSTRKYRGTKKGKKAHARLQRGYRRRNWKAILARMKKRREQDPIYAITGRLRRRIRGVLNGEIKTGRSISLLGCTAREFCIWLEVKFLPGMTWQNRNLWHIDHRMPISSFDLTTETGQRAAFHFTNCQPLWAGDNMRKGARLC